MYDTVRALISGALLVIGPGALAGDAPAGEEDATPADAPKLGELQRAEIDAEIQEHVPRIRACYDDGLRRDSSLAGKVTVKFVIGADGAVTSAQEASGDLADEAVVACVVDAIGQMSFPEPEGGGIVIVSYPFVFTPDDASEGTPAAEPAEGGAERGKKRRGARGR